jgi:translocation and assembly module TamB
VRHPLLGWSLRILASIVVLILLLAGSLAFVLNTQWGTRWALETASQSLPGDLAVGEFEGTMWRGLRFRDLRYANAEQQVEAHDLEIRVDWPATALGRMALRRIAAAKIRIDTPRSGDPEPLSINMPPLPAAVVVNAGALSELQLFIGEQQTTIRDIRIRNLHIAGASITAEQLALGYDNIDAATSALAVTLAGDVPVTAQVTWQIADGDWSGSGPLRGSLAALQFEQAVAGPYPADIEGTVKLLDRIEPELDIAVTWSSWSFGDYRVDDGKLNLVGLIDQYNALYGATLIAPGDRQLLIEGTADGNLAGLESYAAEVRFAATRAQVLGELAWSPELRATGQVSATGIAAERELQVRGNVELTADRLLCSACRLTMGPNTLDVEGAFADGLLDFSFALDAPRLAILVPGYAGALTGEGSLTGAVETARLAFSVQGRRLTADGADDLLVDANSRGELLREGDDLVATIIAADLTEPRVGTWQLGDAFSARWSAQGLQVDAHAWTGDFGNLRVSNLSMAETRTVFVARLDGVPIGVANAWLPGNMRLAGTGNADIDLQRQSELWSGSVTWQQQNTSLTVTEINDQVTVIDIPQADLVATLQDGGLQARSAVTIAPGITGTLEIELARRARDAPLRAHLQLQGDEFDWVPALFPFIDQFEGSLAAEISAAGPASKPDISGEASWRNGRVLVPAANVPLSDINIMISGGTSGSARLEGSAAAGDGRLAFVGQLQDLMQQQRSLQIAISGDNAELVNWPEYRLWATPDLNIVVDDDGWRFSGDVAVPRAEVALRELPVDAVTLSPDVIVLGEEREERAATRFTGEARLILGDEVHFNALGLETRLLGELLIRAPADRPPSATGTVSLVDGSFGAYGQKLTLRDGKLTFTGPLDDPIVDVKAVRIIETFDGTVTAGLHLRGRAKDLTSTVFAEPAMADADALSYLVIGRPLNEATEAEGGDLSGAAVALGLKQATRLTQQIGQTVGLDQLSLTGDGGETTALVAGKQVNSRLYARYAYGVFSRIGALLLRYRLSKNLTLEAGTGETQSIDILYSIERD